MREIYHEKKMRQQVRENNQELRELESKLRTAYVSKALAAQKKEREAMMLAEKIQDKHERENLEKARLAHLEHLKKEQEIERERKKKHHKDLTEQIVSAHKQHQKLYEEFLREKYYLDEIAQRVKEELLEQAQKKVERKEKTKKEMDAFRVIKKELERIKEIETDEENQRIVEYCQKRDKKIEEDEKRQRELEKNREHLNEKMVAELSELMVSLRSFLFCQWMSREMCKRVCGRGGIARSTRASSDLPKPSCSSHWTKLFRPCRDPFFWWWYPPNP